MPTIKGGHRVKFEIVATCLFGLEHLLGEEIDALGYERTSTIDGRVTFEGDAEAVARANVFLRYAEHIYIKLGSFRATSFDALFEGVRDLPFEAFIGREDAFPVKGHSINSTLHSIPDCQKIIKKAIATRLTEKYGIRWFPETGITYRVEFFILKDEATLMIDTSGEPLYKRGYRQKTGPAPLRETLAAAMAAISRPREEVLLWDPMCGSGTIAIEAAMLMNNIAPGAHRAFAAEEFPAVGRALFASAREEAADLVTPSGFEVFASDIDPEMVAATELNAKSAGVSGTVRAFVADARKIKADGRRGTVVTNPPYGQRLGERRAVETLYREIGVTFRALSPWQIYVITSDQDFEYYYGKKADKKRKLYNGMIPCSLYQFFKNDKK